MVKPKTAGQFAAPANRATDPNWAVASARSESDRRQRLMAIARVQPTVMPDPLAALLDGSAPPIGSGTDSGLLDAHGDPFVDARHLVEPDIAICPHCVGDLFDKENRRYGYPFTNCRQCGPRFSIIENQPYDRAHTSMGEFPMCVECASEYLDLTSRWYHAQPQACPECGPRTWYVDNAAMADSANDGAATAAANDSGLNDLPPSSFLHNYLPMDVNPDIAAAVATLLQGGIVAVKGMGGFYLMCLATDNQAVNRLRANKGQPHRPLAVMVRNSAEAAHYCHLSPAEKTLLTSPEAPIVLLRKRPSATIPSSVPPLANQIAPSCAEFGMILPNTALCHILIQAVAAPLVITSGNRPGEPICTQNGQAWKNLRQMCDGFLFHSLGIVHPCEESVVFVCELTSDAETHSKRNKRGSGAGEWGPGVQIVRRSRGLVPRPVRLPKGLTLDRPLLAVGADRRNVAALAVDDQVFLTQHLGELTNPTARHLHRRTISDFEWIFQIRPQVAVCDLHPQAISSMLAKDWAEIKGQPVMRVQHHHAHIAACLADNNHTAPAIGLCFDDLGYGPDGSYWGGEVLWGDLVGYERRYHLEPIHLPGGEYTDAPPCQVAVAYLRALVPTLPTAQLLALLPHVTADEVEAVDLMRLGGQNVTRTSSMARLCHAVGAMLGLCRDMDNSRVIQAIRALGGQATMVQERGGQREVYPFDLVNGQIRLAGVISSLVMDRQEGVPVPEIAHAFFRTLAAIAVTAAERVRTEISDEQGATAPGISTVALAGEVWQSRLLLELAVPQLRAAGFEVLLPRSVPGTDAGIAYGQAVVIAARLARERMSG